MKRYVIFYTCIMKLKLCKSFLCVTPGFIRGKVNQVSELNSERVSQSLSKNLMLGNLDEVGSLLHLHPPDKSGGYAQTTPTE